CARRITVRSYGVTTSAIENVPSEPLVTALLPLMRTEAPLIGSPYRSRTDPLTVAPGGGGIGPPPAHPISRPRLTTATVAELRRAFMIPPRAKAWCSRSRRGHW